MLSLALFFITAVLKFYLKGAKANDFSSPVFFYVINDENRDCNVLICDGNIENPFPSFSFAMERVFTMPISSPIHLLFNYSGSPYIIRPLKKESGEYLYGKYDMELAFIGLHSQGVTFRLGQGPLYIEIPRILTIKSITFTMKTNDSRITLFQSIEMLKIEASIFFTPNDSPYNHSLSIVNCTFLSISSTKNEYYYALIFVKVTGNKGQSVVNIVDSKFQYNYLPGALLYASGTVPLALKVTLTGVAIENQQMLVDFDYILTRDILVDQPKNKLNAILSVSSNFCLDMNVDFFLLNSVIFSIGRFFLMYGNNNLNIANMTVKFNVPNNAYEFLISINDNTINIENSFFGDFNIIDDYARSYPDFPFPPELMKVLYTKAFFRFDYNNVLNIRNCNFIEFFLFKQDLDNLGLIYADTHNTITIIESKFINFLTSTFKTEGGVCNLVHGYKKNIIFLKDLTFKNQTAFTYKQFTIVRLDEENDIEMNNILLVNISMKTRFSVSELSTFFTNIKTLSFNNSINLSIEILSGFTFTSLISAIVNNTVEISNLQMINFNCLYGCILTAGTLNNLRLIDCYFSKAFTETLGLFTVVLKNRLSIAFSYLNDARSVQGTAIFSIRLNNIFLHSLLFLNLTTVPFLGVSMEMKAEGSLISAIANNTITLINVEAYHLTTFERGGALSASYNNFIYLEKTHFESVESLRIGGLIYIFYSNYVIINEIYLGLFGSLSGGAIYLEAENKLTITEGNFFSSKAFWGGVIYADENNKIELENISFHNLFASSAGSLAYFQLLNTMVVTNCSYSLIESRFCSGLYHLNSSNIVQIFGGRWLKGEEAISSFLYLESENEGIVYGISFLFFLDKNVKGFFALANYNLLNVTNCTFEGFENHLIGGFYSNNIYLTNVSLEKFNLNDKNGSIWLVEGNYIKIYRGRFLTIQSFIAASISAETRNIMTISNSIIKNISILSRDGCFLLVKENLLEILNTELSDVYVSKTQSIIVSAFSFNDLVLKNCTMYGYFVSVVLKESYLFFLNLLNTIEIKDVIIESGFYEKPNFYPSIFYLNSRNSIKANVIRMKLKYYQYVLISLELNTVFMEKYVLKDSLFVKTPIVLLNESHFYLLSPMFINNDLDGSSILIYSFRAAIILKGANVKGYSQDKTFIHAVNTTATLINIDFNYCAKRKGNLINIPSYPKIICTNESVCAGFFLQIFCSYNNVINKSNIYIVNSHFRLDNSAIYFNKGLYTGGVFYSEGFCLISIIRTQFIYNQANLGAVFYLEELKTSHKLINNTFHFNKAIDQGLLRGKGGVFYVGKFINVKQKLEIYQNYIKDNTAEIGAVSFFADGTIQPNDFIQYNFVQKNVAFLYGFVFASFARRVVMLSNLNGNALPRNEIFVNWGILSNWRYKEPIIHIVGYDIYDQMTIGIWDKESKERQINLTVQFENQVASEYTLVFENSRLSVALVQIIDYSREPLSKSLTFEILSTLFAPAVETTKFTINVFFRNCEIGEYLDVVQQQCLTCPSWFYSFEKNFSSFSTCQRCLYIHPFYCYGGNNITNKPGFWRVSDDSGDFLRCPNRKACKGDKQGPELEFGSASTDEGLIHTIPVVNLCDIGYTGSLCAICETGYGNTGNYQCSSCGSAQIFIIMALKITFKVFIVAYSLYNAFELSKALAQKKGNPHLININFLIKSLLNHCQLLYILSSFPLNLPPIFTEIYTSILGALAPEPRDVFTFDCILYRLNINIELNHFNMLLVFFHPTITVVVVVIIQFGYHKCRRRRHSNRNLSQKEEEVKDKKIKASAKKWNVRLRLFFRKLRLPKQINQQTVELEGQISIEAVILVVFMINYLDILKIFLESFSFFPLNGKNLLIRDLRIDYDSHNHQFWIKYLGAPVLAIVGFFMPIYIFIRVFIIFRFLKNASHSRYSTPKRNLNQRSHNLSSSVLYKYGYFFFPYKESNYYYEFVYLIRKVILVNLQVFYIYYLRISERYNTQSFAALVLLIIYAFKLIHSRLHPFNENYFHVINRVESWSMIVQTLSSYICLLWLINQPDMDSENDSRRISSNILGIASMILMILINVFFFIFWTYYYFKFGIKDIQKGLLRLKSAFKSLDKTINSLKFKLKRNKGLESQQSLDYEEYSPNTKAYKARRQPIIERKNDSSKNTSRFQKYKITQQSNENPTRNSFNNNKTIPLSSFRSIAFEFSKTSDFDHIMSGTPNEEKSGERGGQEEFPASNLLDGCNKFWNNDRKQALKALAELKELKTFMIKELNELRKENEELKKSLEEKIGSLKLLRLLKKEILFYKNELNYSGLKGEENRKESFDVIDITEDLGEELIPKKFSPRKSIKMVRNLEDENFFTKPSEKIPEFGHKEEAAYSEPSFFKLLLKSHSYASTHEILPLDQKDRSKTIFDNEKKQSPGSTSNDGPIKISTVSKLLRGSKLSDYYLEVKFQITASMSLEKLNIQVFNIASRKSKAEKLKRNKKIDEQVCFINFIDIVTCQLPKKSTVFDKLEEGSYLSLYFLLRHPGEFNFNFTCLELGVKSRWMNDQKHLKSRKLGSDDIWASHLEKITIPIELNNLLCYGKGPFRTELPQPNLPIFWERELEINESEINELFTCVEAVFPLENMHLFVENNKKKQERLPPRGSVNTLEAAITNSKKIKIYASQFKEKHPFDIKRAEKILNDMFVVNSTRNGAVVNKFIF